MVLIFLHFIGVFTTKSRNNFTINSTGFAVVIKEACYMNVDSESFFLTTYI
jgi:hypothetical protein